MIEVFKAPNSDFIGKRRWAYIVSVVFIALGLVSMWVQGGLRYGIDFSGGTLIQARFEKPVPVDRIRGALDQIKLGESVIQEFGDPREFIFRLPLTEVLAEEMTRRVQEALAKDPALGRVEIRRVEFVGPQVGRDLQLQALWAVLWGMAGILIYVAIRFDLKGGVASIAAIVHDVLVCLGAMSVTGREMSLPVLAALLTIIGYSVNDTIVAYDRIRENRGKGFKKGLSFAEQINIAINQTLSRTVLTALTVFFSTIVLFLFGGKVLEDLAFVLTVGVITGTYSTIYIAGALIVDWTAWAEARAQRAKKAVAKAGSA
ncbi:MAG: protein translocase subunit SecF [Candidatus Rokubacteria bacterium]|nr:protein translocase subunit SecF [Candidatus Rokubacteria bacterium]MBI2555214.1 protein translocase subunit SecF [Candidatus Rokubacteria bacterium]